MDVRKLPADGREWADITDIDRRPSGNVPLAILESILTALAVIERMTNQGEWQRCG